MQMVRHNHVFIHRYTENPLGGLDILVHYASHSRQSYRRDVEGAVPYYLTKKFLLIFGAYRHEIDAVITIIIGVQSHPFPCWPFHHFFLKMKVPKNTAASTKMMVGPVATPL